MTLTVAAVEKMLEGLLPDKDLFLVGVTVSDSAVKPKVTIMADGDQGISIDQCASISRRLAKRIEEQQGEEFSFVLEVTSPGAGPAAYQHPPVPAQRGPQAEIKNERWYRKSWDLKEVTENGILLTEESKGKNKKLAAEPANISFDDIVKANIVISFK